LVNATGNEPPTVPDDQGGEGFFALHAGKVFSAILRAELISSMNFEGVGTNILGIVTSTSGNSTYTTTQFAGGDNFGYLSTGVRAVFEVQESRALVRP